MMWIDVYLILFSAFCFLIGKKFGSFIYNKFYSQSVILRITTKDGSKTERIISQKEADDIITAAKANKP